MGDAGTKPKFTKEVISFNGVEDDSHETFHIQRTITREPRYEGDNPRWNFCKTAYKPYDVVVTACLTYLATKGFEVTSDGGPEDFKAGIELVHRALYLELAVPV
jgi:hypothetical protein